MKKNLLLLLLFLCSLSAPNFALAGFGADLGAFGGWGKMTDSLSTVPQARMSSLGSYLVPHYSLLPGISLGAYGEYNYVMQLTEPSEVSGFNKAASGYLAGAALVFRFSALQFTAIYPFLGKSTLKKKTSSGKESVLESPNGLIFILGMALAPKFTFDLAYASVKYDVRLGSASTIMGTRTWQDFRAGASVHF